MAVEVSELRVRVGADISDLERNLGKIPGQFQKLGAQMPGLSRVISGGLIAGLGAAAVASTKLAAEFEQSMNVLQATSGASADQMQRLSKLASDLGADMTLPATSASDAAAAMLELSKAGLSVEDTMDAAKGVLQLSAAAQIDNARAAQITGDALNAFSLSGQQATHVADLLAASSIAASGEVTDMAQAMQQASAIFAGAGLSIEELTTAIGLMAKAGVRGSDAGTSLRVMIQRLQAPTQEATRTLQALGVSVYDAQGQLRPLRDLIDQFSTKLQGATQQNRNWALNQIFGADAQRAANIVLAAGVKKHDEMRDAVTKEGAAAKLAEAQNKGLKGAIDGLKSALETAGRQGVAPFIGYLDSAIRKLTEFINWISEKFPQGLQGIRDSTVQTGQDISNVWTETTQGIIQTNTSFWDIFSGDWGKGWKNFIETADNSLARAQMSYQRFVDNVLQKRRSVENQIDKFLNMITGRPNAPTRQDQIAANVKQWAAERNALDPAMIQAAKMAEQTVKKNFGQVGEAIPQAVADGVERSGGKVNDALEKLRKQAEEKAVKLTPRQQQLKSAAEELAQATARLNALQSNSGDIAADVAARFNLLTAAERANLVNRLTQIDRLQKQAQSMRQFRAELDKTNAEIRAISQYHPESVLQQQFPFASRQQLDALQSAKDTLAYRQEAARQEKQRVKEEEDAQKRLQQALERTRMESLKLRSQAIYGDVNREALAIDELGKTFAELNPIQQQAITQMFNYKMMSVTTKKAVDDFTEAAKRRIEVYEKEQKAAADAWQQEMEIQESRRKQKADENKTKTDDIADRFRRFFDGINEEANRVQQVWNDLASSFQGVFEQAFLNLDHGFKGFFDSIIQGVNRLLAQIAAQFIASQAVKALFGLFGQNVDTGGSILGTVLGRRASGGPVVKGQPYLVGRNDSELFVPRESGHIYPHGEMPGGGINITFNISTPDVDGFRRSQAQLMQDAFQQADNYRRRNG